MAGDGMLQKQVSAVVKASNAIFLFALCVECITIYMLVLLNRYHVIALVLLPRETRSLTSGPLATDSLCTLV